MLSLLAIAAVSVCAPQAMAQDMQPAAVPGNQAAALQAQEVLQPSTAPAVQFTPRLAVTETLTSNVALTTAARADAITRVSPGLSASSRRGRVQGFFDYSLDGLVYARGSRSNELLNALRANGSAEVLEQHGFIDASASVSQQAINPLGVQSTDTQLGRGNRTEVRTLQLAPRLQGRLGAGVEWAARASHSSTRSTASEVSDSSTSLASLEMGNGTLGTRLGWSVQASRTQRDFSLGRRTESDILRGVLDYRFSPEFSTGLIGGYESTDIASLDKEGRATYGLRLNWLPSVRTRLSAEAERRFFGNAYNVNFSHRLSRAVVSYTASRSLSNGSGQAGQGSTETWNTLFDRLLATGQPGAEAFVEQRRADLVASGVDLNSNSLPSFLSSGVTLQQSQQLSLAWVGARDTLTLAVRQSNSRRADEVLAVSDVFAANDNIRQRGYSLTLSHKLTPVSDVAVGFTHTRSSGDTTSTTLRSLTAQWSTRLGPRSSVSLLGRHARFESSTQPYDESALIGTFGLTF